MGQTFCDNSIEMMFWAPGLIVSLVTVGSVLGTVVLLLLGAEVPKCLKLSTHVLVIF